MVNQSYVNIAGQSAVLYEVTFHTDGCTIDMKMGTHDTIHLFDGKETSVLIITPLGRTGPIMMKVIRVFADKEFFTHVTLENRLV